MSLFQITGFIMNCLNIRSGPISVTCDMLSICSHLVRSSPEHLDLVTNVFKGSRGEIQDLVQYLQPVQIVIESYDYFYYFSATNEEKINNSAQYFLIIWYIVSFQ